MTSTTDGSALPEPASTPAPSWRPCAECERPIPEEALFTPAGAPVVCDSHVEAAQLLGRRRSSTLRMLAQKHGSQLAVVAVGPLDRAEHERHEQEEA